MPTLLASQLPKRGFRRPDNGAAGGVYDARTRLLSKVASDPMIGFFQTIGSTDADHAGLRVFGSMVQPLVLSRLHVRPHLFLRRFVALQFVGHAHPWYEALFFSSLRQQRLAPCRSRRRCSSTSSTFPLEDTARHRSSCCCLRVTTTSAKGPLSAKYGRWYRS